VRLLSTQNDLPSPVPHLLQLVRALMDWNPPPVHSVDEDGRAALSAACCMRQPQLPLLRELVTAFPAEFTQPDEKLAQLPLHHLLQHAGEGLLTLELVKLLSDGGATPVLSAVNMDGQMALHIFLSRAAPQLEIDVLHFLCDACPAAVSTLDNKERSTLMCLAAVSGSMDVATVLLKYAPSLSAQSTHENESALHFAAERMTAARLPLFLQLLQLHPQHAGIVPPKGGSVLLSLLRSLLNSSEGDAAAVADPVSVLVACKALLTAHPSLRLAAMAEDGELPIHIVARMQIDGKDVQRELFQLLLEADGEKQLAACQRQGRTPLHCLAANAKRATGCFELVVQTHRAAAAATDADGRTAAPLLCTQLPGPSAAEVECLEAAAPGCFALVDKEGCTPLHLLCRQKHAVTGSGPSLSIDAVRAVLSAHPAAAAMPNADGDTPLILLCEHWSIPAAVSLLIEAAPPNSLTLLDKYGCSALDYACKVAAPLLEVLQLLLSRSPQPPPPTFIEQALHSLCTNPAVTPDLIELLLKTHETAATAAGASLDLPLHSLLQTCGDAPSLLSNVRTLLSVDSIMQCQRVDALGHLPVRLYLRRAGGRDPAVLRLLLPSTSASAAGPSTSGSFPSSPFSLHLTWSGIFNQFEDTAAVLTAEELRILVPRMPRAVEDDVRRIVSSRHCTPSVFAVLMEMQGEAQWPLSYFFTLLSSKCLSLDMVRQLVSAYPSTSDAEAAEWRSTRWTPDNWTERSALGALLHNAHAQDSPDFAAMLQLVAERALPNENEQFDLLRTTEAAVYEQLLKQKAEGHVQWPLRCFHRMLDSPFVTSALVHSLLSAFPSLGGADADKWRKNWGEHEGSALHAFDELGRGRFI
jgi:ankyrin repeat protein